MILGWDFELKKSVALALKTGKVASSEGVETPDSESIKEVEKNGYKYLQSFTKYLRLTLVFIRNSALR